MIITYIFHSCYAVETENCTFLFDFYQDVPRPDGSWWVRDYLLAKPQDLYVFCTHSHADHFNPEILGWKAVKNNIKYIFSKELLNSGKTYTANAIYLDKLEVYRDEHLAATAFGSTDAGASFLVETLAGKRIFHAGDLNNWHWNEEVPKKEALTYENNYLCELELLAEHTDSLHVAMFPIDPRLGKDYMRGAEQFVKRISTDHLLPMHFGEDYEKANAFCRFARLQNCNYLEVKRKGMSFSF